MLCQLPVMSGLHRAALASGPRWATCFEGLAGFAAAGGLGPAAEAASGCAAPRAANASRKGNRRGGVRRGKSDSWGGGTGRPYESRRPLLIRERPEPAGGTVESAVPWGA